MSLNLATKATGKINVAKKRAGLLLPVFALRHEGDLGVGDVQGVIAALGFLKRQKFSLLQLLPINETGPDNSPYNAISSLALDPVYLSFSSELVPGYKKEYLSKTIAADELAALSQGSVNYSRVKALKLELLWLSWLAFSAKPKSASFKAFEKFEKEEDWLAPYSLFRVLVDENQGNVCWTMWPEKWQTLKAAEDELLKMGEQGRKLVEKTRFYSYVQWVAFSQWGLVRKKADEAGIELMGDIPFGVSRYSADVWSDRETFDLTLCGGAPPEPYFQDDRFTMKWGQNWGIPLYNWDYLEKHDYAFWRRRVEKTTRIFHYFRIDHVLGFFRIYAFPWLPERNQEFLELSEEEVKALTGGKLPGFVPFADEPEENAKANLEQGRNLLTKILSFAGSAGVVAEDLGVVPDYVRPCLQELGIPGFTIPIFERDETSRALKPLDEQPPLNLVTYGSHDHSPLLTFYEELCRAWHGPNGHEGWLEVQRFMRFLGLDEHNPPEAFTDRLHHAALDTLMRSPCWLAVLMISDLLGTGQRFNVPGIAGDSNWSERLEYPLENYEELEPYKSKLLALRTSIEANSRV
jgi:4-alpha-glucanotransferase